MAVRSGVLLLLVTGGASAVPVSPILAPTGENAGAQLGLFVSDAGDVNGDGIDDFIVGAPGARTGGVGAGQAWVYFGGPALDAAPDLVLSGESAGDQFGTSARGCGDVNGDSYDDIVVGAPHNDAAGSNAGRAYVYFGGPSLDAVADIVISGVADNAQLGYAVAGAGDVNGGGDDLLIGAPSNTGSHGRAYVYFGGAALDGVADVTLADPSNGFLGWSVGPAGDFDGDGWDDVLVGGNTQTHAFLFRGGPGFDGVADLVFAGDSGSNRFGYGLAPAGDVNGDGYADVIIGDMHNSAGNAYAGRADVYFGGPGADGQADLVFTGTTYYGIFGRTVAGGGDLNGDGFDDLVIGAPTPDYAGLGPGRAFVFFGGDPAGTARVDTLADVVLTGAHESDRLGSQVAIVRDQNGDDRADVMIGANLFDTPTDTDAGKFYLYSVQPPTAPIAVDDTDTTGIAFTIVVDVLANDVAPGGDLMPASVIVFAPPSHGTAVSNTLDGTIAYTPVSGYAGMDTLTYLVSDTEGATSDEGTVRVEVIDPLPLAVADTFATSNGAPLVVNAPGVLANDSAQIDAPLMAVAVVVPQHGDLELDPDGGFTYTPAAAFAGTDTFTYRAVLMGGASAPATVTVVVDSTINVVPPRSRLVVAQNTPNPFNPATTILFSTGAASHVRLTVYDLGGRHVASLIDATMDAGEHTAVWHGQNDEGATVASGTYVYRVEAAGQVKTRTMSLLR